MWQSRKLVSEVELLQSIKCYCGGPNKILSFLEYFRHHNKWYHCVQCTNSTKRVHFQFVSMIFAKQMAYFSMLFFILELAYIIVRSHQDNFNEAQTLLVYHQTSVIFGQLPASGLLRTLCPWFPQPHIVLLPYWNCELTRKVPKPDLHTSYSSGFKANAGLLIGRQVFIRPSGVLCYGAAVCPSVRPSVCPKTLFPHYNSKGFIAINFKPGIQVKH